MRSFSWSICDWFARAPVLFGMVFAWITSLQVSAGTPPIITVQPQSTNLTVGQTAILTVAATGDAPLLYQWTHNGTNLTWGTTASITLTNADYTTAGFYAASVSNQFGGVVSASAMVQVGSPPIITLQPQSTNLTLGQTAILTVAATGDAPLLYQWTHNGTNLFWATTDRITLTNAVYPTTGLYAASVSNQFGGVVSASALVNLSSVPLFTNEPTAIEVYWGLDATFSVGVYSQTQVGYQWYFGSTLLTGQTNATLFLRGVTNNNAGFYYVVATNAVGSATSSSARLIVDLFPPPSLRLGDPVVTDTHISFPVIYLANSGETNFSFSLQFNPAALTNATLSLTNFSTGTNITVVASSNAIGASVQVLSGMILRPGETNLGSASFSLAPGATNLFDGRIEFTGFPLPLLESPPVINTNVVPATTNTVILTTGTPPSFTGLSNAAALNFATGLIEASVEVANPGAQLLDNLFLTVAYNDTLGAVNQTNLITLYNATGTLIPSGWFINEGSLAAGERRWLLLQYYSTDRSTVPSPLLTISGTRASVTNQTVGSLAVVGSNLTPTNGITLRFPTHTNYHYYVQYSPTVQGLTNPIVLQTALPALLGTGGTLLWTDTVPPNSTNRLIEKVRFYRVIETQ